MFAAFPTSFTTIVGHRDGRGPAITASCRLTTTTAARGFLLWSPKGVYECRRALVEILFDGVVWATKGGRRDFISCGETSWWWW